jgi:hypothetical protein
MLRMKSCPTCNRMYADDAFTFCLDDGALLSAPYDPNSTLQIPAARDTDQPRTEILWPPSTPGSSHAAPPQATLPGPAPFNYGQAVVPRPLHEKRSGTATKVLGGVIVLLSAGVILLGYMVWRSNQSPSSEASKNNSNLQANSAAGTPNVPMNSSAPVNATGGIPSKPTGTPSSEWLEGIWEGRGYQHSPKTTWTLKLTASNGTYLISYPSLRCGGVWMPVEIDEGKAKFKELISNGLERCSSNGDILIEKISDSQVSYKYTLPMIGEVATATLSKGPMR